MKDIGASTAAQWSNAMGYENNRNGLTHVIKRIRKDMPDKLKIYYGTRPRLYEAK